MKACLVVFPIKGRSWCFLKSADPTVVSGAGSALPKPTLRDLWKQLDFRRRPLPENAETAVDFAADKINRAWAKLAEAPSGTIKSKFHGLGLRLLSRVKPSENFLKSITKDVTEVEVTYPTSLNPRFVRRRIRHVALRGSVIHKKYFYGSLTLLPFTSALAVLPLPNFPFFWVLFRTYSHWLALKGSERLLNIVSDGSESWNSPGGYRKGTGADHNKVLPSETVHCLWALQPSEKLDVIIRGGDKEKGLSDYILSDICELYGLDKNEVLKYRSDVKS